MLNLTNIKAGLLSDSPFVEARPLVLAAGKSITFRLMLDRFKAQDMNEVQVQADGFPNSAIGPNLFLRLRAQAGSCTFGCNSCFASWARTVMGTGVANLSAKEMVFQALHVLLDGEIGLGTIGNLTITFMGIGEPFANPNVIEAIRGLHSLIPGTKFILSTTGPKVGQRVFDEALQLVAEGVDLDLQISLHSVRQKWRLKYIDDPAARMNREPMSWTVGELSGLAMKWYQSTGRKAHINIAAGPTFHQWQIDDYLQFSSLFPPEAVIVKLSLEGPFSEARWDFEPYEAILLVREMAFQSLGYATFIYAPEAIDEGGSCGAAAMPPQTQTQTASTR